MSDDRIEQECEQGSILIHNLRACHKEEHKHTEHQLMVLLEGSHALVSIKGSEVAMGAGDLSLISGGEEHSFRFIQSAIFVTFYFELESTLERLGISRDQLYPVRSKLRFRDSFLLQLARTVRHSLRTNKSIEKQYLDACQIPVDTKVAGSKDFVVSRFWNEGSQPTFGLFKPVSFFKGIFSSYG